MAHGMEEAGHGDRGGAAAARHVDGLQAESGRLLGAPAGQAEQRLGAGGCAELRGGVALGFPRDGPQEAPGRRAVFLEGSGVVHRVAHVIRVLVLEAPVALAVVIGRRPG